MNRTAPIRWLALALAALSLPLILGCVSAADSSDITNPSNPVTLVKPLADANQPSAIGGTIFTMARGYNLTGAIIDQGYNAQVTLTGTDPVRPPITTYSTIRGGYLFPQVPPGIYTVSATIAAPYGEPKTLTGTLTHVVAQGNIPALMTNLLLCADAESTTISGTVREGGAPVNGATVSIDITAFSPDSQPPYVSVILSSATDEDGTYQFRVPTGGVAYYVAAHSSTSYVTDIEVLDVQAGVPKTGIDLALPTAFGAPIFPELVVDMVSVTLPAATAQASEQALISRLAVARAAKAPREQIARLEKMAASPRMTRADGGSMVENDIYWLPISEGIDTIRGFHIYRGAQPQGNFTYIGSAQDSYQSFFFDNSPSLAIGVPTFYTITSYAPNNLTSTPSRPMMALPMPQITGMTPAHGESLPVGSATVSWNAVQGARSYVVTKFDTFPTYNAVPVPLGQYIIHPENETSEQLSLSVPGTYYWSVSAYNTDNPLYATAASFSPYFRLALY